MSLRYEFVHTHGEFALAWLGEHYQAPKWGPVRVLGGPLLAFLGFKLNRLRPGEWVAVVGTLMLGIGLYYTLRPALRLALLVRRRHRLGALRTTTRVELSADRIMLAAGPLEQRIDWERVTAAGWRRRYFWFELDGTTRALIPTRVIPDRQPLEALFRAQGRLR